MPDVRRARLYKQQSRRLMDQQTSGLAFSHTRHLQGHRKRHRWVFEPEPTTARSGFAPAES
jgi:hypothetical protein